MLSVRRWSAVVGGVAVLAALPAVLNALPVEQSGITATDLLARIRNSEHAAYSGYAESAGGLALPVTRQFSDVADLFGGTTQLRAWWRGSQDWRVDTISVAGESDTHVTSRGTWTWDYESNTATWVGGSTQPAVRLPTAADLLPTDLARRLLSEARPDEVSRLPAKRIAGRSAPGLRLTPHTPGSTISHVDVWADLRTGLPLRVDVVGGGATVVTSRFLDFATGTPSASDTAFTPPPNAHVQTRDAPDIAAAIDRFGGATPPASLAGIARNPDLPPFGSIGVYGTGVAEFAAAPLPHRLADSLADQLGPNAVATPDGGQAMTIGPLSLLLTRSDDVGTSWLLTGTVTQGTLDRAARQLLEAS